MKNKTDFEWDDDKDRINQEKHGLSFAHAQLAFLDHKRVILVPCSIITVIKQENGSFKWSLTSR